MAMPEHRFRPGQKVQLARIHPFQPAADGQYEVVRQLPDINGELQYRIKSLSEPHERVVKESELKSI